MSTSTITTAPAETGYGLCCCGCGRLAPIADRTDKRRSWVKGEPKRYVHGHHGRKQERWKQTSTGHKSPCWIWLLHKNSGYGQEGRNGRTRRAYQVQFEQRHGPVPLGKQLDHLCRVPACVNPDHLEPVTAAENVRRGAATKLKEAEVREIGHQRSARAFLLLATASRRAKCPESEAERVGVCNQTHGDAYLPLREAEARVTITFAPYHSHARVEPSLHSGEEASKNAICAGGLGTDSEPR